MHGVAGESMDPSRDLAAVPSVRGSTMVSAASGSRYNNVACSLLGGRDQILSCAEAPPDVLRFGVVSNEHVLRVI